MAVTTPASSSTRVRTAGTLCTASGVMGIGVGLLTLVYPAAVPSDRWSYPFPATVQLAVGILLAATHLFTLAGVGALRGTVPGLRRAGRAGLVVSVVGLAALAACELVSGLLGDRSIDDAAALALSNGYAVASLVLIVGSIVGGVAVGRSGWADPVGRWALLASGLVLLLLVTPANISTALLPRMLSLMLWSACFLPLGRALRREPQA